ncbi:MAG: flagellar hook-associated protein FlgK [Armatimonadetes bacterium]|nr:flagellar hook-associated protein FlgK [Armatimonadota bacterium]
MLPVFFGLEVASRAMQAQRRLMEVAQHNITNANTPGYSRQVANLGATTPFAEPSLMRPATPGQMGTGVIVDSVKRFRLDNMETAARAENQVMGEAEASQTFLTQIEAMFNEPGGQGVSSLINGYWDAWQQLSTQPDSIVHRNNLLIKAQDLAKNLNSFARKADQLLAQMDQAIGDKVTEINDAAREIATLNGRIRHAFTLGDNPNDLMDKRDRLLSDLSRKLNVSYAKQANGSSYVYVGGVFLVSDEQTNLLQSYTDATTNRIKVRWANDSTMPFDLRGGELKGLFTVRDSKLGNTTTSGTVYYQMNQLTQAIMNETNQRHVLGYDLNGTTNWPFFIGTGLSDISVTITDVRSIATSVAHIDSTQNMNNQYRTIDPFKNLNQAWTDTDLLVQPVGGNFTINGVSYAWNPATQTMNDLINTINTTAGSQVTARFDPATQRIFLTRNTNVGTLPTITVADVGLSNFVAFAFMPAASTPGGTGDNTNALTLSSLRSSTVASLGTLTMDQFYRNTTEFVGEESSRVNTTVDRQKLVIEQLQRQIESFSGVNLDEEMIRLTASQQAFSAAARMVTAVDDMINRIVGGLGRVGL